MKIRRITATPINLPLEAPYYWAFGDLAGFSMTIVQVETEDGLVGLGEAPSPAAAAIIRSQFADVLAGHDALDIAGAELRCLPSWSGVTSTGDRARITAFGAVEMALWDLRGKAWNQPLYQLLGGAVRKAIPFTDYFSLRADGPGFGTAPPVRGEKTPEDVADYCQHLHETCGTTFFEGKFSTADPAESLAILQAIRDRLGDRILLRIDSNQAYSLPTALRLARPLEELGIRHWEDPVGSFEGMAELARHCSIPFSSHNLDFGKALALRVPHAICTGPSLLGGIGRFVRFAGACEHALIDLWCYSGDTGIGSAAYLHLCAALGWIREPNQSLFRMQPMDVIAEGPFRPRGNLVPVPEGPGLGVTLDPAALEHCAKAFERDGPFNKFRNPDNPDVFRRLPLS